VELPVGREHCKRLFPFIGVIIGGLNFFLLYGVRVLHPRYVDWLLTHVSHDPPKNFLGWAFFRSDSWRFPLGCMNNLGYPFGATLIETDSIPLLGVFFKLFDSLLPLHFQYFGLWGLVSFCLQGFFAALLLKRWSNNLFTVAVGTVFFTSSPVMLYRMFTHTSLAGGHWMILAALYLFLENKKMGKSSMVCWVLLIWVSVLIQLYLTALLFIIWGGYLLNRYYQEKKLKPLASLTLLILGGVFFLSWIIGIFASDISILDSSLGKLSMNLNALFNPEGWSRILPSLPYVYDTQNEGFMYAGAGMLILWVMGVASASLGRFSLRRNDLFRGVVFIFFVSLFFSLSPVLTFNEYTLIEYPRFVARYLFRFWHAFHASGRLFWSAYYLLFLLGFYGLLSLKIKEGVKAGILSALLVLQIFDLSAGMSAVQKVHRFPLEKVHYESPLQSRFWEDAVDKYHHIVLLPPQQFIPQKDPFLRDYETFAHYASMNDMTLNTGYFARRQYDSIESYARFHLERLQEGIVNKNTLYILKEGPPWYPLQAIKNVEEVQVKKVDGFSVLISNPVP